MNDDLNIRLSMPFAQSVPISERSNGDSRAARIAGTDMGIDLKSMDVTTRFAKSPTVFYGHDQTMPIARSSVPTWNATESAWDVSDFTFAKNDPIADKVRNLWDQEILNDTSIGFYMNGNVPVLAEWSIVGVGMDPRATAKRLYGGVTVRIEGDTSMADDKVETRDNEEQTAASEDTPAEAGADTETPRDQSKTDDLERAANLKQPSSEDVDKRIGEEVERRLHRQEFTRRAQDLLPSDTDGSSLKWRDLLIKAAGNEVPNAANRSDDYLEGAIDMILARRADAPSVIVRTSNRAIELPNTALDLKRIKE